MGLPVRGPCRPPRWAPARFPPSRAPGLLARLGTPHAVAIGPSASARGTPRCVAPGSQLSGPACARRPALAGLPRSTPRPVVTRSRASRTSTTRPLRVPGPRLRRLGRGDRRRLCLRQRLRQVCAATCPSLLSPAPLGLARARARGCICTCVSARAHVCACLGAPFSLEHHARSFSPMICPPPDHCLSPSPFLFLPCGWVASGPPLRFRRPQGRPSAAGGPFSCLVDGLQCLPSAAQAHPPFLTSTRGPPAATISLLLLPSSVVPCADPAFVFPRFHSAPIPTFPTALSFASVHPRPSPRAHPRPRPPQCPRRPPCLPPSFPAPCPPVAGRPGGFHPSGRQTGTSRCPPAFHRLCPSPLRVFHVCVVSCVLSDRGWGSIPQRLWRDGSPSWSVSGRCPPRRGLRVLALQVRSSRPAVPFIPSCPGPLAGRPAGTWRS